MIKIMLAKQSGFTLVELISVIVILGILAAGMTTFLRFGTQSYTDAADRDELISTARFVVERLNREVRNALPNSIRTTGLNNQCLEFVPIDKSVVYIDIPVAPEAASTSIEVLMLEEALSTTSKFISVYALNVADIYAQKSGVIEKFSSIVNSGHKADISKINFTNAVLFDAESPTGRLYIIDEPVSYCIENEKLFRHQGYTAYKVSGIPDSTGVLMADFLQNLTPSDIVVPFQSIPATLQRNGLAQVRFKFVRNDETIIFSNEIQVPNVP